MVLVRRCARLVPFVGSPPSCCAALAAILSVSTGPGRVAPATLSRMALALFGASLPGNLVVRTMDNNLEEWSLSHWAQVVAARVARWRTAHGLQLDEEFVFAFCSLEDAVRVARIEVAGAWQHARVTAWLWSMRRQWPVGRWVCLRGLRCPGAISRCAGQGRSDWAAKRWHYCSYGR